MFLQKSLRAQILALLSGSLLAMLLIALASFHFLSNCDARNGPSIRLR